MLTIELVKELEQEVLANKHYTAYSDYVEYYNDYESALNGYYTLGYVYELDHKMINILFDDYSLNDRYYNIPFGHLLEVLSYDIRCLVAYIERLALQLNDINTQYGDSDLYDDYASEPYNELQECCDKLYDINNLYRNIKSIPWY